MNQVTQQNASSSEESASAAEEMSSEAEEMRGMVAQFQLTSSNSQRARTTTHRPTPQAAHVPTPPASVKRQIQKQTTNKAHKKQEKVLAGIGAKKVNGQNHSGKTPQETIPLDDDLKDLQEF
jgi:methyl-accepting chemotaxis protein